MTPLLPTPNHYLHNLLTMTSSEATRLWRKAIKETFDCTCVYCGKTYDLHELTCQLAPVAIKEKVVMSGRAG